ncbi:hypothetical protein HDE_09467 [Halotydeus destructor]|nr:hypothetical protein HDE_09467 [Halotydeus destructor]
MKFLPIASLTTLVVILMALTQPTHSKGVASGVAEVGGLPTIAQAAPVIKSVSEETPAQTTKRAHRAAKLASKRALKDGRKEAKRAAKKGHRSAKKAAKAKKSKAHQEVGEQRARSM